MIEANKITQITRRDIFELFRDGFKMEDIFSSIKVSYPYYGRLNEIDFLKKLYPLDTMESFDDRFPNAESDIWQHTVNNDDYETCWVFSDKRFNLEKGSDDILLNFICAVFHPENRNEKGYWRQCFDLVSALLIIDGYELYESGRISNREVYSWRLKSNKSSDMGSKKMTNMEKGAFVKLFNRGGHILDFDIPTFDAFTMDSIGIALVNKYRLSKGKSLIQYTEEASEDDVIKLFSDLLDYYETSFNEPDDYYYPQVKENNIKLALRCRTIIDRILNRSMVPNIAEEVKEIGLKDLIKQAESYINSDKQVAIEKLWDALERLKTYYTDKDKKASASKIVNDMSNGEQVIVELFNDEFAKLTSIGNNFRIRHHETSKIEIKDIKHIDYLYARCHALINLALKYIN